jgi:WD40 repeat protein
MTGGSFDIFMQYLSQAADTPQERGKQQDALREIRRGRPVFDFVALLAKTGDVPALNRLYGKCTGLHKVINQDVGFRIDDTFVGVAGDPFQKQDTTGAHAVRALGGLGLALTADMTDAEAGTVLDRALAWYANARGSLATLGPWDPRAVSRGKPLDRLLALLTDHASREGSAGAALTTAHTLIELAAQAGLAPRVGRSRPAGVTVLLLRSQTGRKAHLRMPAAKGLPPGLVPDPRQMALFSADQEFQRSLDAAWSQASVGQPRQNPVFWSIEHNGEASPRITGQSAGAAFAVTLNEALRLRRPLARVLAVRQLKASNAIVGRIDDDGRLKRVAGYAGKLAELSPDSRVIVPATDVENARSAVPKGMRIVGAADWKEAASKARVPNIKVILTQVLAGVAVLAIAAGLVAWSQNRQANSQRAQSMAATMLVDSRNLTATNPGLAAQLAVAAWQLTGSSDAWDTMLAAAASPQAASFDASASDAWALSPDGKTLATISGSTVRLFNAATQEETGAFHVPERGQLNSMTLSPDGKTLAIVEASGTVQVSDITTGQEIRSLPGGTPYLPVTFSPDGKTLVTISNYVVVKNLNGSKVRVVGGSTLRMWDLATGQQIGHGFTAPDDGVLSAALSSDGKFLAAGSANGTSRVWNLATGRLADSFPTGSAVGSVRFSPAGPILAVGTSDSTTRLWNVTNGRLVHRLVGGHETLDQSLAFSPDGKLLAVGSSDGTARVWDMSTGLQVGSFTSLDENAVISAAFSADGTTLTTVGFGGEAQVWDIATSLSASSIAIPGGDQVDSVAFGPDAAALAASNDSDSARAWNVTDGKQAGPSFTFPGGGVIDAVAISPDGRTMAAVSDGKVLLWNVVNGSQVGSFSFSRDSDPAATDPGYAAAFSSNGKFLVTASDGFSTNNRTGLLWNVATRQKTAISDGSGPAAISSNGKILAVGRGPVQLWNLTTGSQIGSVTVPGGSEVNSVAISPDGNTLATGDQDGTIQLWDISTQQEIGNLTGPSDGVVASVAFSQDGKTLLTASDNGYGSVLKWDVAYLADPASALCALTGPLTRAQWARYAPGLAYQSTCQEK